MKDVIYNFINEHMMIHIVLIALCIAATIGAMFVDLVSGIMKAKQRGEARTSTGYKKTAIKAKKYFTPFIELCFIDLLCCVVIPFPVFQWFGRVTAFSVSLNQFVKNHGRKRSCAKQKRQWVWSSRTRMILPGWWLRYCLMRDRGQSVGIMKNRPRQTGKLSSITWKNMLCFCANIAIFFLWKNKKEDKKWSFYDCGTLQVNDCWPLGYQQQMQTGACDCSDCLGG